MISLKELKQLSDNGDIDTVITGFTDLYGRLLGKRCDAGFFLENVATAGTHGCNYFSTVDMEMEPIDGYAAANWEAGYGDFHLVPDTATLQIASWLDRTAIVFCNVQNSTTHELIPVMPRSVLTAQLQSANQLGYTAQAASELEYN